MADGTLLFNIDAIVVDGVTLDIEDSTGVLSGAARYEYPVVVGGTNEDSTSRKRIPTTLKCKLMFKAETDPDALAAIRNAQISARDTQGGKRALMPRCSFASLGDIGGGSVDITFNVLSPIQWL